MPKFAPNLFHLFTELPVRARFAAAAAFGFEAVEWHFPYELPKHELKALLDKNGLQLVHALTPTDWTVTPGLAGQPDRIDDLVHWLPMCSNWSTLSCQAALWRVSWRRNAITWGCARTTWSRALSAPSRYSPRRMSNSTSR